MCKVCAFTGHRDGSETFDYALLERVIINLIKNGTTTFLCGMARGFDMLCAELVIKLRAQYAEVKLIACLPCRDQSSTFSQGDKVRYNDLLSRCDEVKVLAEEYYRGCMFVRDRYLVDNCDVLLSFLRKTSGGTYYTTKYAKSCCKKIIEI